MVEKQTALKLIEVKILSYDTIFSVGFPTFQCYFFLFWMTNDTFKESSLTFAVVCKKIIDTRDVHARLVKDHHAYIALEKLAVDPGRRKYSEFKDVLRLLVLSDGLFY